MAERRVLDRVKEGKLLKRQRGKHVKGQNFSGLKFQNRFVRLDKESLDYFVNQKDKARKGNFPVSLIRFVEEVPQRTFSGIQFGFQIGHQEEVMYFGTRSHKECLEWINAIRQCVRLLGNEMLSHYHLGVFGKEILGQWSCCKEKGKSATGCCETTRTENAQFTQSEITSDPTVKISNYDEASLTTSLPIPVNDNVVSESAPPQQQLHVPEKARVKETLSQDTISVSSRDSGFPDEKYGSKSSLGSPGMIGFRKRVQASQVSIQELGDGDQLQELARSEILEKHGVGLHYSTDQFKTQLNALDFRGNSLLLAGGKNGEVHVFDVCKEEWLYDIQTHSTEHEVITVETWRNFVLISTRSGVELRDLDDKSINIHYTSQSEHFAVFSPNGSKVITVDNEGELQLLSRSSKSLELTLLKVPGTPLLLSISPDPNVPNLVVGVAKNGRLLLCVYDYNCAAEKGYSEVDIGDYQPSHAVCAAFSPSEQTLAVGHGNILTLVSLEQMMHEAFPVAETAQSITVLCYSPGQELVVGMSNGDVAVLDGHANKDGCADRISLQYTFEFSSQNKAVVTSATFSNDSSLLALGHSDGTLDVLRRLRRNPEPPIPSKIISIPSSGHTLRFQDDDITVTFPDGFISQSCLSFEHAVTSPEFFDPHSFPEGVRPVSVILYLHPLEQEGDFLQPIEVTLPHFIDVETEEDLKKLAFFKAVPKTVNGKKVLNFEHISSHVVLSTSRHVNSMTHSRTQYASFAAKHCCYLCVGEYFSEDTNKARFCITRAQVKSSDPRTQVYHHILHYNLPTCIKVIRNQYSLGCYRIINTFGIKFDSDKDTDDPGIGIEVLNPDDLKANGWGYWIENDDKIYRKDINFWEIPSGAQLVHMCQQMIYPPRFILNVFYSDFSCLSDTLLKVTYPGAVYEFQREEPKLGLQLWINSEGKLSKKTMRSPQSEASGTCETTAIQSMFYRISKTVAKKFDFALELVSNGLLTDTQMDSLGVDSLGQEGSEQEQMIQNYKILREVKNTVSKEPEKFDDLCEVLEKLEYTECSKQLRATLKEHQVRSAAKLSLSGSEKSSTSLSYQCDDHDSCSGVTGLHLPCKSFDSEDGGVTTGPLSTSTSHHQGLSNARRHFFAPAPADAHATDV